MKKLIAVLLTLCCLLPVFAACGDKDEVPDNMQEAAIASAPYHLYVPTTWLTTTESGVSGARVNSTADIANVTVTAYYPDEAMTPAAYFENVCLPGYTANLKSFSRLTELDGDTTLGGKDAKCYVFVHTLDDTIYQVKQIIVAQGSVIYVLTYTAKSTNYDTYVGDVEEIRAHFTFR